jgi:hypothetical protein
MRHLKLNLIALVCGLVFCSGVFAVSFGDPLLRSYLGQSLNVQVPISGIAQEDLNSSCIHGAVKTIEGDTIATAQTEFILPKHNEHNVLSHGPALVKFITREEIVEPAITLSISVKCGPLMQRNFSLLLDYADISTPAAISSTRSTGYKDDHNAAPTAPKSRTTFTESTTTQKTAPKRSQRTKSTKNSASNATAQPPTAAVKPKESITQKLVDQPAPPKDELKISNEVVTQSSTAITPPIAENLAEKHPVDIEQQRIQENSLAEERFAAMLHDEPALAAEQAVKERNEQQLKVQQLETELQRLKLQIQSNSKPPEHHYPMALMVMNIVVLLVLLVLLIVVGKLWLSLRKSTQPQHNHWWNSLADNQQKKDGLPAQTTSQKAEPGPVLPPQKTDTKQNPPVNSQPTPKEPHLDTNSDPNAAEHLSSEDGNSHPFNMFASRSGQSIQIEELSDSTQEAEFWVSLDNPKRAIEILESQSLDENLTMPVTLLYLLDLYRQVGDEGKYAQLSARLKRKFNIHIPQFGESVDPSKTKYLDDYEHVTSRCCAFWNTNYIVPYLESLLIDDREGDRIGFDLSVYRDILFLISICKELDRTKNTSPTSP